jgi:hypothetical protein
MLFSDEGKKIKELEARLKKLEKRIDRKFEQIEDSFGAFRDIVVRMQTEKNMLEKEKEELEAKLSLNLNKKEPVEISMPRLHQEVKERFVRPVRKRFEEDVNLIRRIAKTEAEDEKNEKQ